jgi:hypothetical protein
MDLDRNIGAKELTASVDRESCVRTGGGGGKYGGLTDPHIDGAIEEERDDGSGFGDTTEEHNEELLHESTSRLTKSCTENINGSLASDLSLFVKRDVSHLFRRIEESILRRLQERREVG